MEQTTSTATELTQDILISIQAAQSMRDRFKVSVAIMPDLSVKPLHDVQEGETPVEIILYP